MFKRIRPISLILLAGAFSFPKSAWAFPDYSRGKPEHFPAEWKMFRYCRR